MNTQPAQQVPASITRSDQSLCLCHDMLDCPDQDAVEINATQLARIAELLDTLDGFLCHADGVADRLADYLRATGRDRAQPPHGASYDANLLIDQVSFTAHALRAHRQQPLE
ncbi:hypothetical protein [Candidatus Mycobacterium methanotrophicum]|uniref:Uncharacterized protein n=1 Tax=Candidatus Mycobacterium methanotrophicum TaxID=2943498 RepID=A0ABY4QG60_9MYCO|nr:hypothetical protein [Candidatus Mycobacterium methanotrophicum]UQX09454.1 hypothetical protein M5I08_13645 [Candidatus Mycobacterium methanotrophicum]